MVACSCTATAELCILVQQPQQQHQLQRQQQQQRLQQLQHQQQQQQQQQQHQQQQLSCPYWMYAQQQQSSNNGTTTSCSAVEHLKQQLLRAVEDSKLDDANEVIAKLEKCVLSKEILEATRVGAVVNEIRKRMVELAPQLSKRCRSLIKCWQKLAETRSNSNSTCGSNNGTPQIASPAHKRGALITPGTPARSTGRLTSAALSTGSRSSLTSPAIASPSGSYAPSTVHHHHHHAKISPQNTAHNRTATPPQSSASTVSSSMHKSHTIADIPNSMCAGNASEQTAADNSSTCSNSNSSSTECNTSNAMSKHDVHRNGKRKLETMAINNDNGLSHGSTSASTSRVLPPTEATTHNNSKRAKNGLHSSASASATTLHTESVPNKPGANESAVPPPSRSVKAARIANVQPTSELVAQLSENLPHYMAINLGGDKHDTSQSHSGSGLHVTASTPSFGALADGGATKKKDHRGRPSKKAIAAAQQAQCSASTTMAAATPNATVASGDGDGSKATADDDVERRANKKAMSNDSGAGGGANTNTDDSGGGGGGHVHWNRMLPTLDTLRHREHFRAKPSDDPSQSYILNVRGREVLALPYLDTGIPDFLEYNFPESSKYYAEENFIYGAPRPE